MSPEQPGDRVLKLFTILALVWFALFFLVTALR